MSSTPIDPALVADVARDALTRVAPEELPLFRATATAYFKRRDQLPVDVDDDADDMLAFGDAVDLSMVTPVVLAVATAVVQLVSSEVAKAAGRRAGESLGDYVAAAFKRLGRKDAPQSAVAAAPTLTSDQLARVRQVAFDKAVQLRLPSGQANLLADAMVGTLAVSAT
jgi:hypothetical protein